MPKTPDLTLAKQVCSIGLALCSLVACQRAPDGKLPGTLERERIELPADANEAVTAIAVHEGQVVHRGDLLLTQDQTVAGEQLARLSAATAQAQAQLEEQQRGARETTILGARARRDQARAQADDQVRERERLKGLISQNLVSRESFDRQSAAAAAAAAALREAQSALRELELGTRHERIAQAQQALAQARAQQRELTTTSSRLEVRAPLDAIVDALPYRVGEKPPHGATVAVLLASGAPFARVHVPEPLRLRVKIGSAASIRLDGAASEFKGHVRYIASEAAYTPYFALTETDRSQFAYVAEVTLDDSAAVALPAGIPLTVQLTLESAP